MTKYKVTVSIKSRTEEKHGVDYRDPPQGHEVQTAVDITKEVEATTEKKALQAIVNLLNDKEKI